MEVVSLLNLKIELRVNTKPRKTNTQILVKFNSMFTPIPMDAAPVMIATLLLEARSSSISSLTLSLISWRRRNRREGKMDTSVAGSLQWRREPKRWWERVRFGASNGVRKMTRDWSTQNAVGFIFDQPSIVDTLQIMSISKELRIV